MERSRFLHGFMSTLECCTVVCQGPRRRDTMAMACCMTEMGMGVDIHGLDYTLATMRAVCDAMHHSSLGFARLVGATADDMTVHVTIGAPRPDRVNAAEVAATLPHGHAHVTVVMGGLELLHKDGSDGIRIANAIITVS